MRGRGQGGCWLVGHSGSGWSLWFSVGYWPYGVGVRIGWLGSESVGL